MAMALLMMAGCRTEKATERRDTVRMVTVEYRDRWKVDSTGTSVYHWEWRTGDTCWVRDSVDRWRLMVIVDSVTVRDTAWVGHVEYVDRVRTEKRYPLWWLDVMVVVGIIGLAARKIYVKFKQ